ncbi:galactokinase [Georgenia sp. TF02-10]|uniref:galactokinase n=1 Tax=Georgenia sp. TF02-10 TaxID=2917725 RepID=UPI001FA7551A|nr:galactokinase [Georgenia sp. TF02-10]UNX54207.1 galactokinase [Georgenia sp. TF02-10]
MSAPLPAWSDAEGAGRARAVFAAAFDGEPAGVWTAPGRVNLIGEHTDYNDGLCLPIALEHRTFVALRPRADRTARLVSAQEPDGVQVVDLDSVAPASAGAAGGAVTGWPAYVAGVAWALERDGLAPAGSLPGFDLAVDSCVPYGAGLSSSAAIEAAVAIALDDAAGLGLGADDDGRARLAAACVRAENEVAGAPTGGMDQAAALRARAGHALLLDCRDGSTRQVPLDLAAAGLALLVIDTRAEHRLVDGQYARRRQVCEEAAAVLGVPSLRTPADAVLEGETTPEEVLDRLADDEQRRRVRHVLAEIGRVMFLVARLDQNPGRELRGRALDRVAEALDDSHTSLRDDYEVSAPELDLAVETARAAGAHGARMTGGGFGGSAIALVDAGAADAVADAVAGAFAGAGFTPPAFLLATAGGAARRVG